MLTDLIQRVTLAHPDGRRLSWGDVLQLWRSDAQFAAFYTATLAATPFEYFFWECPPVSLARQDELPFEHVAVRAPPFRKADPSSFRAYLAAADPAAGADSFLSLGRDALLVSPTELGPEENYGHIAAFVRRAPPAQHASLWAAVGKAMQETLDRHGAQPRWLSTEGSSVPWIHVRLDSRPKYYHHSAYTDYVR